MMEDWKKLIAKELRKLADKFDAGTSEVTEEQAMDIVNMLTHIPMNKERACRYLNMSRSKFDSKVQNGLVPKGRKRLYSKEKVWWRDELDECKKG
jgi:transcriptional regulator with AAA-type ATPase domain